MTSGPLLTWLQCFPTLLLHSGRSGLLAGRPPTPPPHTRHVLPENPHSSSSPGSPLPPASTRPPADSLSHHPRYLPQGRVLREASSDPLPPSPIHFSLGSRCQRIDWYVRATNANIWLIVFLPGLGWKVRRAGTGGPFCCPLCPNLHPGQFLGSIRC